MTRTLLLLLGLLAGCATVPTQSSDQASPTKKAQACTFDIDCPSGNCDFGECSPFSKSSDSDKGIGIGSACLSGTDCSNNICQGEDCH
ncbi:MAG: hypothetical protein ACJ8AT_37130 [Hyalangium sp.]|uniref:hypothetical protein n=1 Tax=Hyalangium sp. TaxID=2028555 RepID=UPI00389B22A0